MLELALLDKVVDVVQRHAVLNTSGNHSAGQRLVNRAITTQRSLVNPVD